MDQFATELADTLEIARTTDCRWQGQARARPGPGWWLHTAEFTGLRLVMVTLRWSVAAITPSLW